MKRSARNQLLTICTALLCSSTLTAQAVAQNAQASGGSGGNTRPGLFVNDQTGHVYQKVTRTVERPTTETRMETRTETVYTPQVVTTRRPEKRTYYSPVVQYEWEPRWHGTWNPFRQPTLAYHPVARTRWQARSESVERTERHTQWVAEHRTREVPTLQSRIDRQTVVDYEVVGRLQNTPSRTAVASNGGANLRPLRSDEAVIGLPASSRRSPVGNSGVQIATSTSSRGLQQSGIAPTVLSGGAPARQPVYGGSTIATAPVMSRWR